MINLLRSSNKIIGTFENYSQIVDYINKVENYRHNDLRSVEHLLKDAPPLLRTRWFFVYYAHDELKRIYSFTGESPVKIMERRAFDNGLDLIEIKQWDYHPEQIPVTADIDVEAIRRDWCRLYFASYGGSLVRS